MASASAPPFQAPAIPWHAPRALQPLLDLGPGLDLGPVVWPCHGFAPTPM
ncbi:hypothetical protein [Synechococcus sp. CCY 9618]|nr:hypothetical protein [Synechococcus sp. CCY 9618]